MSSRPLRILLIEDDPEDAHLIKRQLKKVEGFEHELVHHASLASALQELDKSRCDAIITDMNLPDAHGEELFDQVQKKAPRIPIIILSGTMQNRELATRLLQSGAQDFFVKTNFNGELIVRSILYAQERVQLDIMKDDFIGFASHELRTPLTILQEAVSNLSNEAIGPLNEKQKRMVELATKNIERLIRLINNLLDLSRLESGMLKMHTKTLQLATAVQEVVGNFERLVQPKGIQLRCEMGTDFPKIQGDEDLLTQVLNNLLGNAIRYAKKEIVVSLEVIQKGEMNGLKVTVWNDGPSLTEEELDQLFQKYSQVKRPTGGSGYKGTGLGLALCRGILDQHGGRIWGESGEGKGVRFCFVIPILATI